MKKIALFLMLFLFAIMARAQEASISGFILKPDGGPVTGVTVKLLNAQGQVVATTVAGGNAQYQFSDVPAGQEYTVVPELSGQALEGVSTLDIVIGAQYILAIIQLDSPFKLLAADVNDSSSLTTLDLIEMRRLILGVTGNFAHNWLFFRTDIQFANDNNPWAGYSSDNGTVFLEGDVTGFDFYAVKVGDLSW